MSNTFIKGSGMKGSSELQTSVAEQEILPSGTNFLSINFLNDAACTVSLNGGDYVYFKANQGFKTSMEDFIIHSMKIKENGITFVWSGVYQ